MTREATANASGARPRASSVARAGWPLLLFAGFFLLDAVVLRGALHGPFVSDDFGYIVSNPYIRELSMENLAEIFDPASPAQIHAVGNYSPVHTLLHALEWQIFADRVTGYHWVNIAVHALASVLLVAWLLRCGAPWPGALAGGAFFTLHPANVEAVAWISQLKTSAALALALGALLAFPGRRGLATALFGAGLLVKAAAAFALPTALVLAWSERADRRAFAWLGVWGLLLLAFAWVEFAEFGQRGWVEVAAFDDPWVQLRSIAAGGTRYLVMAATSLGVSAYHEPDPVLSPLDSWWLASLPLAVLLTWRIAVTLRRREAEAACWISAAASFAPVSQIFPFVHGMADHYLYFILPGLIGGSVLWASGLLANAGSRARGATFAALAVILVFFAWHSAERARLWRSELTLLVDAARNYPQGWPARMLAARRAAQSGDVETAVAELRAAHARGIYEFRVLESDPGLAPIRQDPAFRELVREWAGRWIERAHQRGASSQSELRILGLAHVKRGEWDEAVAAYERALATGGPDDEQTRLELEAVRELRAQEARGGEAGR